MKIEKLIEEFNGKYGYYKQIKPSSLNILLYGDFYSGDIWEYDHILFDYCVNQENFTLNDCIDFEIILNMVFEYYFYLIDGGGYEVEQLDEICHGILANLRKAMTKCLSDPEGKWVNDAKEFLKEITNKSEFNKKQAKNGRKLDDVFVKAEETFKELKKYILKIEKALNKKDATKIKDLVTEYFGYDFEDTNGMLSSLIKPAEIFNELSGENNMQKRKEEFAAVVKEIITKAEFKKELSMAPTGYVASFPGGKETQEKAGSGSFVNMKEKVMEILKNPIADEREIQDVIKKLGIKIPGNDRETIMLTLKEWLSQLE